MGAVWSPPSIAGPVVVAAGSVVEGAESVVVASVVVGSTVVVGAVVVGAVVGWTVVVGVVGSTVVAGVVTVGWVVALNVESAWVVLAPPAVARGRAADGGAVVTDPLRVTGTVSGVVVDEGREPGGSRVVDADVGAGWVGSATPGVRGGGGA